jgi:hypothetical protein
MYLFVCIVRIISNFDVISPITHVHKKHSNIIVLHVVIAGTSILNQNKLLHASMQQKHETWQFLLLKYKYHFGASPHTLLPHINTMELLEWLFVLLLVVGAVALFNYISNYDPTGIIPTRTSFTSSSSVRPATSSKNFTAIGTLMTPPITRCRSTWRN